ncbi:hypothetical protein [Adlercreutzia sp. ZJ304]|uniref:hypothetical protein n=1 Tax=Adlercreutzia sp. ZJ304 TaxID=2709791 RepID=UPI0013ED2F39|nr:hypothetical protein [Adlercreutzia sp. ZJ304]
METNTLAAHFNDNVMDRKAFVDYAKQSLSKVMDINHSIAMRQIEVLSMQTDETQTLLQSGNLTDEQFDKALEESEKIRQTMSDTTMNLNKSNFELVVGTCVISLIGSLYIGLRAA